jgi:hypothetical protein
VWAEVLVLCVTGSLYPVALVAIVGYLGGERRIQHGIAFVAGGALVCAATGTAIVIAVRAFGITQVHHQAASGLTDVLLGAGVLAFSLVLLRRDRRQRVFAPAAEPTAAAHDDSTGSSRNPPLWESFVAGVLIYAPMLCYFASVKILAEEPTGVWLTASSVFICIVVSLLIAEIPIALVAVAGQRSEPLLHKVTPLVVRYTKPVLLTFGGAAGLYLIFKGVATL